MRQQYAWRSKSLAGILALVAVLILAQMIRIQTSKEADAFRQQADDYKHMWQTFYPERGEIYDRSGHLLAGNRIVYEVGLDLQSLDLEDAATVAAEVSAQLGIDYNALLG